jgi:hypothetical protein
MLMRTTTALLLLIAVSIAACEKLEPCCCGTHLPD